MATTLHSEITDFVTGLATPSGATVTAGEYTSFVTTLDTGALTDGHREILAFESVSLSSAIQRTVINKVWDVNKSGGAGWVMWATTNPDPNGFFYPPGHGAYGVDTDYYRTQSVVYTEPE